MGAAGSRCLLPSGSKPHGRGPSGQGTWMAQAPTPPPTADWDGHGRSGCERRVGDQGLQATGSGGQSRTLNAVPGSSKRRPGPGLHGAGEGSMPGAFLPQKPRPWASSLGGDGLAELREQE